MAENPVWFIRHAESRYNAERKTVGNQIRYSMDYVDAGITECGHQQIQDAREKVLALPISEVFVSPLWRALQTAEGLFRGTGLKITVVPLLTERVDWACDVPSYNGTPFAEYAHFDWSNLGPEYYLLEYLTPEVINLLDPSNYQQSLLDLIVKGEPEVESEKQMQTRVQSFRNMIAGRKHIAIVGHGNFIRGYTNQY